MSINIGFAPKTVQLDDGSKLHFWYANNKGRGRNNCTIIRSMEDRAAVSESQESILFSARTSSWSGNVNFSKEVRKKLGVE